MSAEETRAAIAAYQNRQGEMRQQALAQLTDRELEWFARNIQIGLEFEAQPSYVRSVLQRAGFVGGIGFPYSNGDMIVSCVVQGSGHTMSRWSVTRDVNSFRVDCDTDMLDRRAIY